MTFDLNVETVPAEFQTEMIDLQCDADLRNALRRVWILDFYKLCLPANKFPYFVTLHGERQAFVEAPVFENSYIQKWKWSVEIDWTM